MTPSDRERDTMLPCPACGREGPNDGSEQWLAQHCDVCNDVGLVTVEQANAWHFRAQALPGGRQ